MKRVLKLWAATIALTLLTTGAMAQENSNEAVGPRPVWMCVIGFQGQAEGIQLVFGRYTFIGNGEVHCIDGLGANYSKDITLKMDTSVLGLGMGIGKLELTGMSAEFSLLNASPEVIFGNYKVAQGQAAIFAGLSSFAAIKVDAPQIALQISVQAAKGFGAHLGLRRFSIQPAN